MRLRVVLYTHVYPPAVGGMERYAQELSRGLALRGHVVTVLGMPAHAESAADDAAEPFRVVRGADARSVVDLMRAADVVVLSGNTLKGLAAAELSRRPVVMVHHGYQAACPSGMAWSPAGACSVGPGAHGPCGTCSVQGWQVRSVAVAHRRAPQLVRANVCVSAYQARRLALPHAHVIFNPINAALLAHPRPGPGEAGHVAFAGRLVEEKGLDLLLQALVHTPEARLSVAGDGPMRSSWEGLAGALGVASRVAWLGRQSMDGVAQLYARVAVVCAPSAWDEPFGYVVAEAMALQRCVVAAPSGAFAELLAQGRGWVAADRSAGGMAAALREALGAPAECVARAHAAYRFAGAELALGVVAERYEQLFRRVLAHEG